MGISADKPAAQKKFKEKYHLPFPLLSDTEKTVVQAFDALKEKVMYGRKTVGIERCTFVIGADGKLQHIFRNVRVAGHVPEVLEAIREQSKEKVGA